MEPAAIVMLIFSLNLRSFCKQMKEICLEMNGDFSSPCVDRFFRHLSGCATEDIAFLLGSNWIKLDVWQISGLINERVCFRSRGVWLSASVTWLAVSPDDSCSVWSLSLSLSDLTPNQDTFTLRLTWLCPKSNQPHVLIWRSTAPNKLSSVGKL